MPKSKKVMPKSNNTRCRRGSGATISLEYNWNSDRTLLVGAESGTHTFVHNLSLKKINTNLLYNSILLLDTSPKEMKAEFTQIHVHKSYSQFYS